MMKSKKLILFIIVQIIAFEFPVIAQIIIKASDYTKIVGKTKIQSYFNTSDLSNLKNIIENTGANRVWDLLARKIQLIRIDTLAYLSSNINVPYANDPAFSNCTYIVRSSTANSIPTWLFFRLDQNSNAMYGLASQFIKITYSPAFFAPKFPVEYGSSWSGNTTIVTSSSLGGVPTVGNMNYTVTVDSYGIIKTPFGIFDCLRIKQTEISNGTGSYSYSFMDRDQTIATIQADANNIPTSLTFYVTKTISATNSQFANNVATNFAISQNYPNPFNPETIINYQIPRAEYVTLKVYDVLGREVATLVDEYKQPGNYNSEFSTQNLEISSGVYFYRLTAGSYSETKKLVLTK